MDTTFNLLLIWVAFILVYFQDHIKAIYQTLRPNPFSWRRWWAVVRGTFTRRTAFPIFVIICLTVAIILVNTIQGNEDRRIAEESHMEIQALVERIDDLIDQNAEILEILEAYIVTGNDTATDEQP